VTDNKFVERASVALPGKQDELLVRHTHYRHFNRQTGRVRQQHAENVAPPARQGDISRAGDLRSSRRDWIDRSGSPMLVSSE